MKVALIGAPGSGKTKLAQAISRRLNKFAGDTADQRWEVVDGYVDRLIKKTGLEYGPRADWPMNVQILGHRWEAEAAAVKSGYNAICVGSIYETATYATLYTLTRITNARTEQEMLAQQQYIQTMMDFIGAMEVSTVDYDLILRLELAEPDLKTWEGVVNAKLPEVLDAYFRKAYLVDGKTTKEKADAATEAIREVQRVLTSTASDSQ